MKVALLPARVLAARGEGRYRLLVVAGPTGPRRPGQYAVLSAQPARPGNPYAIASLGEPPLEFLIRPEPGVAEELIAAGEGTIYASAPQGPGFPDPPGAVDHAVLFASGSGIAPIHAQLQQLAAAARRPRITLYYGEERSGAFAFRDRFEHLAAGRDVRVVLTVSRDEPGWTGARGWVQDVAAADAAGWDPQGTAIYVCGMPAMEAAVRALAARRGLAEDRILTNL